MPGGMRECGVLPSGARRRIGIAPGPRQALVAVAPHLAGELGPETLLSEVVILEEGGRLRSFVPPSQPAVSLSFAADAGDHAAEGLLRGFLGFAAGAQPRSGSYFAPLVHSAWRSTASLRATAVAAVFREPLPWRSM